jgi:hypothetical protein
LNDSAQPFCLGLPGAIECQLIFASLHHANIALLVSSVPLSLTIMPACRAA